MESGLLGSFSLLLLHNTYIDNSVDFDGLMVGLIGFDGHGGDSISGEEDAPKMHMCVLLVLVNA